MTTTIFLAAYNACSGMTDLMDSLRTVLTHWPKAFQALNSALPPPSRMTHPSGMNVSPNTGFMRNVANLPDRNLALSSNPQPISSRGITPSLKSVAQLICLFQETTRACILGACNLGVFLSVLTARLLAFENTLASCFVPKCWVGFLSVVRILPLERIRIAVTSLADLSNQLSGHHRLAVDVEYQLDSIMRTPRN